ncbi:hypothetical protein JHK84_043076 [Glycine max]|uniref:Uncharacterized protein n=1 Tax=Glycine soja TaxID=3848 RepID=A0A445GVG7_GLYSO|nr:hypothetical protein JHK84_043076 [Glycine max]RZB65295.1 hypothetical protein D0Y65_041373 [Glycine soja]
MMQIQTRQEEEGFGSGRSELSIIICLKIKILASGYSQNLVIPSILIFVEGKCGGNGIKGHQQCFLDVYISIVLNDLSYLRYPPLTSQIQEQRKKMKE